MEEKVDVVYQRSLPDPLLTDYIQCFWTVRNIASTEKKFTILPDGYFDILFQSVNDGPFTPFIMGLWTREFECVLQPNSITFAISFRLLAVDYIFKTSISSFVDKYERLPADFWTPKSLDFSDFDNFVSRTSQKLTAQLTADIDHRKQHLFHTLYASNGALTVEEISNTVHWSSRQINRYFNNRFGISLKAYGSILRYRASFAHLKDKQLYPEQNYTDQAHFIKEVKKYSSVTPKQLAKNQNDRFIQLSTLPEH